MKFLLKNFERLLFYFLFFAIPLQTRTILYYPGWYYNEWQSVSIYATDLILLALFIFWAMDNRQRKSVIHRYDYFLLGFLITALVSVKNSSDFYVGFFLWLKLLEFILFYFYLKSHAVKRFNFVKILYALIIGGIFQAVIAIGQFLKQGDLGLRWLGESVLGLNMTGIASFFVPSNVEGYTDLGLKVIRAYGTTPHSNILATYLLLSIFAIYFVWLHKKQNAIGYLSVRQAGWLSAIGYPVILFGFFFTFSRTVIFVWVAGFLIMTVLVSVKQKFRERLWQDVVIKKRLIQIFITTFLTVIIFSALYWPEVSSRLTVSSGEEAVSLRIFYNEEALGGGINLFGIGLGDFTGWLMEQNPNLPRYMYQPVHNIHLLIYSEIGVLGFIFFLFFLAGLIYEFIKKTRLCEFWHYSFLLVVVSIFFIGLFDHFLITLQQGRFVFWLGLTLLAIGDIIETTIEKG